MWFRQDHENFTFSQIWESYDAFKADYDAYIVGFAQNPAPLKADSVKTTYYLLFAKYGNNPIANSDPAQFKMKVLSVIFSYGPTWERKQEVQTSIRALTEADLLAGAKQIYNHAFNPSSAPSTSTLEELTYINDQNTALHKKSKIEAYSILWNMLHADATKEYIDHFKNCFAVFVDKYPAPFYIGEEN